MQTVLLVALLSAPYELLAASDFRLETLDGQWQHFSEYIGHGKWTVVNIWAPRCPPCQEEIPELEMFHQEHQNNDAIVIGIAIDFPSYRYARKDQVIRFVDDHLIDFPVLLSDSSVTEKIGAGILHGLPSTYMYNPDGKLVGQQVGGITKAIIENFIERYESENNSTDIRKK